MSKTTKLAKLFYRANNSLHKFGESYIDDFVSIVLEYIFEQFSKIYKYREKDILAESKINGPIDVLDYIKKFERNYLYRARDNFLLTASNVSIKEYLIHSSDKLNQIKCNLYDSEHLAQIVDVREINYDIIDLQEKLRNLHSYDEDFILNCLEFSFPEINFLYKISRKNYKSKIENILLQIKIEKYLQFDKPEYSVPQWFLSEEKGYLENNLKRIISDLRESVIEKNNDYFYKADSAFCKYCERKYKLGIKNDSNLYLKYKKFINYKTNRNGDLLKNKSRSKYLARVHKLLTVRKMLLDNSEND